MINFGFLSLNIIILLAVIFLLIFISFKTGKKLLYSLIISIYPSVYILKYIPFIELNTDASKTIAFIVIYAIFVFILYTNLHPRNSYSKIGRLIEYSILTISFLLLFTAISFNEFPKISNFINFSKKINDFIKDIPYNIALIIPIISVLVTTKKNNY